MPRPRETQSQPQWIVWRDQTREQERSTNLPERTQPPSGNRLTSSPGRPGQGLAVPSGPVSPAAAHPIFDFFFSCSRSRAVHITAAPCSPPVVICCQASQNRRLVSEGRPETARPAPPPQTRCARPDTSLNKTAGNNRPHSFRSRRADGDAGLEKTGCPRRMACQGTCPNCVIRLATRTSCLLKKGACRLPCSFPSSLGCRRRSLAGRPQTFAPFLSARHICCSAVGSAVGNTATSEILSDGQVQPSQWR